MGRIRTEVSQRRRLRAARHDAGLGDAEQEEDYRGNLESLLIGSGRFSIGDTPDGLSYALFFGGITES